MVYGMVDANYVVLKWIFLESSSTTMRSAVSFSSLLLQHYTTKISIFKYIQIISSKTFQRIFSSFTFATS